MRSASPHRKTRKVRSTGRHRRPSQLQQAARRAGKAGPALAVSGALAAAPFAVDGVSSAAALAAPVPHTAPLSRHTSGAAASRQVPAHLDQPASVGNRTYQPRHAAASAAVTSPGQQAGSQQGAAGQQAPTCSGSGGMLPQNYATIVSFLTAHGYTNLAAAGIAGNIFQESGGNPESVGSGGGGLIGFTPLPQGLVTGNPSADLQAQLQAVLSYNQQWSAYIPALNASTSAVQAADIYMNDFERPGMPAAANREEAAQAVAQACGF